MQGPKMKETMLRNRTRLALFWFTIAMILVVAVMAVVTIVRLRDQAHPAEIALAVNPREASLCPGETQQFSITVDDAAWESGGGTITDAGLFTAGSVTGDYQVVARATTSEQQAVAVVHVLNCDPTPSPTETLAATAAATAAPTVAPEVTAPTDDPQGDVLTYEGGVPAQPVPDGVDIRLASINADLSVQVEPSSSAPQELLDWVQDGELLFWITTYEPVPADVYPYWLFALDTDADTGTGRPPNTARINPDLGDEATVNLYYDSEQGQYVAELSVWSPTREDWVVTEQPVRYTISESRTVIGLAVPLSGLKAEVFDMDNVAVDPGKIRGRAAALSYAGEEPVIDFYPDRPQ